MESKQIIRQAYKEWQEIHNEMYRKEDETLDNHFTEADKRAMFLADGILGMVNYDGSLDLYFGKIFVESMIHIHNRTTFEYIEDDTNYKNFILSCNYIISFLDWGTSIRGAWFDVYDGKMEIDMPINHPDIETDTTIETDEPFMNWFILFLQGLED